MKIHVPIVLLLLSSCVASEKDSVREAQEQNEAAKVDGQVSRFLTEVADACMVNVQEGELASEKAQSPALKEYAAMMIAEQTTMFIKLQTLAAAKHIHLPEKLSDKKSKQLKTLQALKGEHFDKKFIRTMMLDHKRDVREFKEAKDFHDKDVQQYAATYYPVVESHLKKIKSLKTHLSEANL